MELQSTHRTGMGQSTHVCDDVDAQVAQIPHHFLLLRVDLGVREQLVEVLLGNAVLDHHIQGNDADFVVVGNVLEENAQISLKMEGADQKLPCPE